MEIPKLSLQRIARGAAGVASLTGVAGFLAMMGAFGPVSCWTSESASSVSTSGDEGVTASEGTVTRGCEAGIDYLLGSTNGNAPVLFFWAVVLLSLVAVGGTAAWTGHRYVTWVAAGAGGLISIIGIMSIGWYFMLPTLFLVAAATALTVKARQGTDGGQSPAT